MIHRYIIEATDEVKGFEKAIEKLDREWGIEELEPCDDAISRLEVRDLLATWLTDNLTEETWEVLETIDGKVEDMQSVTPWSSWTPASQFPEPNTAVLLYVKYKSSGRWTYQLGMWNDSTKSWEDWRTLYQLEEEFEIIKWMELPEGYEEDRHA